MTTLVIHAPDYRVKDGAKSFEAVLADGEPGRGHLLVRWEIGAAGKSPFECLRHATKPRDITWVKKAVKSIDNQPILMGFMEGMAA